jgi:thioredoxin reductase (NADPH)
MIGEAAMKIYDVIIIGKGPAGISAAIYTKRANLETLIIGKDDSALIKAGKIENYYGFEEAVSGEKLLKIGEEQARKLGIQLMYDEVSAIEKDDNEKYFKVKTVESVCFSRAILLATGQPQRKVNIEGLKQFEGLGVSYCTTCDGYFYRNLSVGVLGFNAYAFHEAEELEAFTKDITIFTNGAELDLSEELSDLTGKFRVNTRPVASLTGGEYLEEIHFKDGHMQKIDGLFVAYGTASSVDFARKMGILTEDNAVIVDKQQATNVEGVFAAGDCTGGFRQISTAVGQGAIAGRSIIEYVRKLKKQRNQQPEA